MRLKLLPAAMFLAMLPALSWAADPAERDIHAFLASVYSHYTNDHTSFDPMGKKMAPKLFTARVAALIRENQEIAAKKGDSAADADPFCDCQDLAGMRSAIGTATIQGAADATATVTLTFPEQAKPIALRYAFNKERGKWLIADIVSDGLGGSFLTYLQNENKELKAAK